MTGDRKQQLQRILLREFERSIEREAVDWSLLNAAQALGPIAPLLTEKSKRGRPTSVDYWRVINMGILLKRERRLSVAAAAKRSFPDDRGAAPGGTVASRRKALEAAYRKWKDLEPYKSIVDAFDTQYDALGFAGRADADAAFKPAPGVLDVLETFRFAELVEKSQ